MELKIFQVDAFTSKPFGGNPAGVVLDAKGLSEKEMQNIAKEMNLSETAFIIPLDETKFRVRFFTPISEVDLCGHATIGSFYTLAYKNFLPPMYEGIRKVYQETKAGRLGVEIYYNEGKVTKVMMEQSKPKDLGIIEDLDLLLDCFNIKKKDIGIGEKFVDPKIISTGLPDIQLPLKNKKILDNLIVDFEKLTHLSTKINVIGVHAFYLPDKDSNIVYTRNFAPLVGIREEAATGTANGGLAYFLKKEGHINNKEIVAFQGESLKRPSQIHCTIEKDNEIYNIKVGGEARIVLEGIMYF
ncbi:Phenazine biosynthesis protein PhzF family [[Clostridium] ultunense Esp]|uniref:Phenazine biosynthesis protein PhzF family n=1 Tax=[Clostridium] ultunense Esp TaxID=1288971 RepID=M1ZFK9_9FIRM|nr:PhzF family phenazine biosynthesis protein [Schnuerera ultunensis]CCQ96943.1 Phenazine biosynthesis protein PhzF family [[Clostridium] ultunense Esp]SHD78053.1 Phenazine biosynthesis protein PhzF family [[Clostridium] ultunense Esp]